MLETYPNTPPDSINNLQPYEAPISTVEISDAETLNNYLPGRIAEALQGSEFYQTPELHEAVTGFYTDHYLLAGAIKATAEGRIDSDLFDSILGDPRVKDWEREIGSQIPLSYSPGYAGVLKSPNAITAAYRLAVMAKETIRDASVLTPEAMQERHFRAIKQCGLALNSNLFQEVSVGVTTIGEDEIVLAQELAAQLGEVGKEKYIIDAYNNHLEFPEPSDILAKIGSAQKSFWQDTRHAGQLEFHGTYSIGGINVHGLMSRNEQVRRIGSMIHATQLNANRAGKNMHSVVPHFSEFYGRGQYTGGERLGTVAVPLIKVIREAPYARDALYGLLIPKLGSDVVNHVPLKTLEHPLGSTGSGADDEAGVTGFDRVFFASGDETGSKLPDEYKISMFDKTEKPATYIIDRNGTDVYGNKKNVGSHELGDLGIGYGFPERLIIEQGHTGEAQVRALQQTYIDEFAKYGIVVPLRRGVFAQVFENVPINQTLGRKEATVYNRYIVGSEKKPVSA